METLPLNRVCCLSVLLDVTKVLAGNRRHALQMGLGPWMHTHAKRYISTHNKRQACCLISDRVCRLLKVWKHNVQEFVGSDASMLTSKYVF